LFFKAFRKTSITPRGAHRAEVLADSLESELGGNSNLFEKELEIDVVSRV